MNAPAVEVVDLGRMGYADAYAEQVRAHERVLAMRAQGAGRRAGAVLVVEHDPVITLTARTAPGHIVASGAALAEAGIETVRTDRGGDVTYHGPGQLVVYPILDLETLRLRLHDYMRLLEQVVIDAMGAWGVQGVRDPGATGVWASVGDGAGALAKVAAMGVRVRRWVTMHGLSLNVDPDLGHFQLIVPCGLAGRPVTSLRALLGTQAPTMAEARSAVIGALERRIEAVLASGPGAVRV